MQAFDCFSTNLTREVSVSTMFIYTNMRRSDGSFPNRVHNGEDITATLPEGTDVCDIGTLSVWCQPFNVVFGFVDVPRSLFVS